MWGTFLTGISLRGAPEVACKDASHVSRNRQSTSLEKFSRLLILSIVGIAKMLSQAYNMSRRAGRKVCNAKVCVFCQANAKPAADSDRLGHMHCVH